jgi:hypothetical protein
VRSYTPGARATSIGAVLAVVLAAVLGIGVPCAAERGQSSSSARPADAQDLRDPGRPGRHRASLRDSRPDAAAQPQFTVTTDRADPGYFGVAILDDYNGGSWTFDTTFHPSGGRIAPAPTGMPGAANNFSAPVVAQQFRLAPSYALPFVPSLDRPLQVRGMAVDADARTGMIQPGGAGAVPGAFSAISRAGTATLEAVPSVDGIATAAGGLDPVQVADTTIPTGTATDVAAVIRFVTKQTGERPAPTLAFLQAVERSLLTKERRIDSGTDRPRTGSVPRDRWHILGRGHQRRHRDQGRHAGAVRHVLRDGRPLPRGPGPAGHRLSGPGSEQPTRRPGRREVRRHQPRRMDLGGNSGRRRRVGDRRSHANYHDLGCRSAAGTCPGHSRPVALPPGERGAQKPGARGQAIAKPVQVKLPHRVHHSRLPEGLLAVAALAVVALLAGPILAASRRVIRRRARRSRDPKARTVGAWLDLLDGLNRCGMPTPEGATTAEVATSAGQHFGGNVTTPIEEVGSLADRGCSRCPIRPTQTARRGPGSSPGRCATRWPAPSIAGNGYAPCSW